MKRIAVNRIKGLKGDISVPGDKSISHRALMISSLAEGDTRIKGLLMGEDNMATLKAFRQMGINIRISEDGTVLVSGRGLNGLSEPDDIIDAGNSGTTIRLMTGILSGQDFFSTITGDMYLRKRPMKRVVSPLSAMGARIFGREDGNKAPLAIIGSRLRSMKYDSPVASAQVKSAILLAGLYAEGVTSVTEPALSRDHTERMLSFFGARVERNGMSVSIDGGQRLSRRHNRDEELIIPGDISSAAFFMVAALITPQSDLLIRNVGTNPARTGIIDILKDMGGDISIINPRDVCGEPVGDIHIRSSRLTGIEIKGNTVTRAIDELPVAAAAAAFAHGTTSISDAGELRVKETDRIAAVADFLRRMQVKVEERTDGLLISGGSPVGNTNLSSHGDHRIAMSIVVAGLASEGETMVDDTECIETSFPGFETLLREVSY